MTEFRDRDIQKVHISYRKRQRRVEDVFTLHSTDAAVPRAPVLRQYLTGDGCEYPALHNRNSALKPQLITATQPGPLDGSAADKQLETPCSTVQRVANRAPC